MSWATTLTWRHSQFVSVRRFVLDRNVQIFCTAACLNRCFSVLTFIGVTEDRLQRGTIKPEKTVRNDLSSSLLVQLNAVSVIHMLCTSWFSNQTFMEDQSSVYRIIGRRTSYCKKYLHTIVTYPRWRQSTDDASNSDEMIYVIRGGSMDITIGYDALRMVDWLLKLSVAVAASIVTTAHILESISVLMLKRIGEWNWCSSSNVSFSMWRRAMFLGCSVS